MAKKEETITESTTVDEALEASLWQSVRVFVAKCGGDLTKVSPEDREYFADELLAWALLVLDDEGEE